MDKQQKLVEKIKADITGTFAFQLYQGAIAGAEYGTDLYSEGIRRLCEADPSFVAVTSEIARRFYSGDIGRVDEWSYLEDRNLSLNCGKNFGEYITPYGKVYIKRESWYTVIFLPFEY